MTQAALLENEVEFEDFDELDEPVDKRTLSHYSYYHHHREEIEAFQRYTLGASYSRRVEWNEPESNEPLPAEMSA